MVVTFEEGDVAKVVLNTCMNASHRPLPFFTLLFLVSLHPPPPLPEPLCIHDGGHMTKGAAPGHVCISAALPDAVTTEDACHVTPYAG